MTIEASSYPAARTFSDWMEISWPSVPMVADGFFTEVFVCKLESPDELQLISVRHNRNIASNLEGKLLGCIWTNHAHDESN